MKFFKKLLIAFFVLLLISFISLSVYIRVYGKDLAQNALSDALRQDVQIGKLSYRFPFSLNARDVYVKDRLQARNVRAVLDVQSLRQGEVEISSLEFEHPVIMIARGPQDANEEGGNVSSQAFPHQMRQIQRMLMARVEQVFLQDGRVEYIDQARPEYTFIMDKVEADLRQGHAGEVGGRTYFDLTGRLVKTIPFLSGTLVSSRGWFDLDKMNMENQLEWHRPDGDIGATAQAVSRDDLMTVNGQLKYSSSWGDLVGFEDLKEFLPATDVEVGAKFSFTTRMSDFRIDKIKFSGLVDAQQNK